MPIGGALKVSADAGNGVKAGSDGGLWMPASVPAVPQYPYLIENGWGTGTGTQYWFRFANGANIPDNYANFSANNTAKLFPISFQKDCKLTGAALRQYSNSTANGTAYMSFYAAGSSGFPAAKITDLFRFDLQVTANTVSAAVTTASPTFTANTLYWGCWWVQSATHSLYCRYMGPWGGQVPRMTSTGVPNSNFWMSQGSPVCVVDTTSGWNSLAAAPATVTPLTDVSNLQGYGNSMPDFYWGVTNV